MSWSEIDDQSPRGHRILSMVPAFDLMQQSVRMKDSLSILFPVRDKQSIIESRVESLLEHLCEISSSVQMIIIDDASIDATPEILDDLRESIHKLKWFESRLQWAQLRRSSQVCTLRMGIHFFASVLRPIELDEIRSFGACAKMINSRHREGCYAVRKIDKPTAAAIAGVGTQVGGDLACIQGG